MNNEKKNITIVGEYKQILSWFPVNITYTKVIKGLAYSEVKSKGLALIYLARTGKKAMEGSLRHFFEP